jgi:predicted amidohydrolase
MQRHICLAQIDIDSDHPERNLEKMKRIIGEKRESDLIVFPELVVHGHIYSGAPRHEIIEMIERTPAGMKEELHAFARECDTRVVFGEFDRIDGRVFNLAVYVSRDKVERYAKTHVHWSESFDAGDELKAFDTPLDRIGVLVCFDSAFPETSRVLALQGAKMIVVIAAVPKNFDTKYMHRRMASIAMNNQVFCIYANRAGRNYDGRSAVFDPRGECVAMAGQKEELLSVDINLLDVDHWRIQEAVYPRRRPELYGEITATRWPDDDSSPPRRG